MKKKAFLLASILLLLLCLSPNFDFRSKAEELDEELQKTEKEIEATKKEQEKTKAELEKAKQEEQSLVGSLSYYEYQLRLSQQQLQGLEDKIKAKEEEINSNVAQQEELNQKLTTTKDRLAQEVRGLYKASFTEPLEIYLQGDNELSAAQNLVYFQEIIRQLRNEIYHLQGELNEINQEKELLDRELEDLKKDQQLLKEERERVKNRISEAQQRVLSARAAQQQLIQELTGLQQKIQELTKKEQEILAQKAAAALASTTVGEIEISRAAIEKGPPQDGQTYFSFWTYGYPHRVGLNQYGAYGRAKAGQNFRQILKAYYRGIKIVKWEVPETIKILANDQVQEIPFEEDYLLGIGEMPSCWGSPENKGLEALKAQAIAARTYALKYTNNGQNPICVTQECQVYVGAEKSKKICGQYWRQAVESTRGLVLTYKGDLISAWYSSTAGGYTLAAAEVWGGDIPYTIGIADKDSQGNFYDGPVWGNSPWFHKAWGDEPWLSRAEVEDLLNASLLPESYDAHLPLPEKGGFSNEEILTTLATEGIPAISNLTSLEAIGVANSKTLLIRAYHDGGYTDIDAQRFRFVFNLRSPGTDALWTSRFDIRTYSP